MGWDVATRAIALGMRAILAAKCRFRTFSALRGRVG